MGILNSVTIVIDDETTWPVDVLDYLKQHHNLFLTWELRSEGRGAAGVAPSAYDNAVYGLRKVLSGHLLHGYHCTRLTETEIHEVAQNGMQPPNSLILCTRIQSLQKAGLISLDIATRLTNENQASASNRAKKIWFCFFPPHIAGQRGIERFFRSWGGEALYNSHEDDPVTGPILKSIGTPCIIEADVPIASFPIHTFLDNKIVRRFLMNRGFETQESADHEDRAECPIAAQNIRRIIRYPESDFIALTRCDCWTPRLA